MCLWSHLTSDSGNSNFNFLYLLFIVMSYLKIFDCGGGVGDDDDDDDEIYPDNSWTFQFNDPQNIRDDQIFSWSISQLIV